MFKRLMIGLFALSLAAIWLSEANAQNPRRRRSVGVSVYGVNPGDKNATFVTGVFGLPADGGSDCGEVRGELYCAQSPDLNDILACDKATGDSAARVIAIDKDSITWDVPPNYFTKWELNFDIKDFGQREQLRGFETRARSTDPAVFTINLPTGASKKKAGFYAITDLSRWNKCGTLTDDQALRRFVGSWNAEQGKFIPDKGFGINGEEYLKKVPGIEPLWGTDLDDLEGETICAAVHFDQIKGDTLHGKYLGLVAFKVLSRTDQLLKIEVLDADDVCGLPLYIGEATEAMAGGECLVADATVEPAVVFAPAFSDGDLVVGEGKFPAVQGTLSDCSGGECKGTVEVLLDSYAGQRLCDEKFGPGRFFVDFIPINRGGDGVYADYAFTGKVESPGHSGLEDTVICGEGVEGGSQYTCVPFSGPIPTCPENCGNTYPPGISNWEGFLLSDLLCKNEEGVPIPCFDSTGDVGVEYVCASQSAFNFTGVWEFTPIAMEAGNAIEVDRSGTSTMLFSHDDCSSWGLYRHVDFSAGQNLILKDSTSNAEKPLDPYTKTSGFPINGSTAVDIYVCEFTSDSNELDYLTHPLKVKAGQVAIFFNDRGGDTDYDDIILVGEQVSP